MASYQKIDDVTRELVLDVMAKYHPRLAELQVSFDGLFAYGKTDSNGIKVGPALSKSGYPCLGKIKATGVKDRAKGAGDFELLLDGDQWPEWNKPNQVALIDHELQHLQVVEDADGHPKLDDADRVRLSIRPHDHEVGWFDAVANRHKEKAWEYRSVAAIRETMKQLKLPY